MEILTPFKAVSIQFCFYKQLEISRYYQMAVISFLHSCSPTLVEKVFHSRDWSQHLNEIKIYFLHVVVWKLGVTFKGVDPIMGESDPAKRDDRLYILLWLELKVFLEKSWHGLFYATEFDILTGLGSLEIINILHNLSLICLVSKRQLRLLFW